jgi:drug/metabolite transporter (DMT)-like permease
VASRRSPALAVVLWSQPLGAAIALGLAFAWGESVPPPGDIAWAALAGLCGPTALVFFYRGLATGRMGVVAPVAGVLGATVPVVSAAITQGLPAPLQVAGIALALIAVVVVTRVEDGGDGRDSGVRLAILAGLGFGAFFVLLGRMESHAVFAPFVVVRLVATLVMLAVVRLGRANWRIIRPSYVPVLIAGTLDLGGNLWYLLAAQQGRIDVAAVLSSLYPVVTILLAAVLLRERIGRIQGLGIVMAVAAIVLITAG